MFYFIPMSSSKNPLLKIARYFVPIIIGSSILFVASCSSSSTGTEDPGDPDPPPPEEPNRLVSFSEDIQPIFNGNCTSSGCHDSGTQESGVDLTSYDAALSSTGTQYGTEIIDPGNPGNSPIVDKIEADPDFGVRMPKDRSALAQSEIDSIRAWIEDGAPNN